MNALVILPTYNEKATIKQVLEGILRHKNVSVLVVDDNSPDKTAGVVKKHKEFGKRVHLLSGEKQGLGEAYKRGFVWAVNESTADAFLEMDADLSHNPEDIPRLLDALKSADVAIGSRYVKGGKVIGWGMHRKILSFGGNLVARMIAGLWSVRDCTAGFRAFRRKTVQGVDFSELPGKGYSFQIALLNTVKRQERTIVEVPVTFTDREKGTSKLGVSDILEFGVVAVRLGFQTYARLIKFLLVGASGLIVNWGVFALLWLYTGVPAWLSIAVATEASILSNFFLNNAWTFKDRRTTHIIGRLTRYHYTALGGLLITYLAYFSLENAMHALVAYPVAIMAATAWNFALSYFWAWKKK